MVLVCLNRSSDDQAGGRRPAPFCVNILAEGQQDLAYQFAGKGDKFADTAYVRGINGVPVLGGTLAHLECRVAETVTGGTHTVFLAHVAVAAGHERRAVDLLPGALRPAGERPRGRGLPGGARPGADPAGAARPAAEPGRAWPSPWGWTRVTSAYALVRLAGEQVVTRTPEGRYVPTPLTVELADQMFGARCVIELGVADACVGTIAEEDLSALDGYAQRLASIVTHEKPSLAEFLDASHNYHRHYVGLGGSPQLRDTYGALGISTLWRRALAEQDWRTRFDVTYHAELTQACRDGDVDRARRLIREHTEQVRELVRDLIDRAGGAL